MARRLYGRAAGARAQRSLRAAASALACFGALALALPCTAQTAEITPFSTGSVGGPLPAPWMPMRINERKLLTRYDLVDDGDKVVLHARADKSASGLVHNTRVNLAATPMLSWRWKTAAPVADADPHTGSREDAPLRIVLEFEGDRSKLPLTDRAVDGFSEKVAGRPLPYATLMYIFAENIPVGTIVPNPHTRRIQMVVVDNGAGVRAWNSVSRNVREDFKRAFGEEAGAVTAIGVLTDTDNTGGSVEAWYGDMRFSAQP